MRRGASECRVYWGGQGSLNPAVELFRKNGCVEIEMPAELHHAVFSHLCPGRWDTGVEQIDERGDVSLLERIAEIDQLADLRIFLPLVRKYHARISIRSPAPHLVIEAPDDAQDRQGC